MKRTAPATLAILLALCCLPAWAELQPSEVAILANANSKESVQLATYYAQKRGIPAGQICQLKMSQGEVMPRAEWDKVRAAFRQWVVGKKLHNKVRCVVTVWDVPLKIDKEAKESTSTRRRKRLLQLERSRRVERLLDFMKRFDEIAPDGSQSEVKLANDAELKAVTEALRDRLKAAEARIQAMAVASDKQAAITQLTQLSVATAGLQVVVQNMQRTIQNGATNVDAVQLDKLRSEYQFGRGRLTGLGEGQNLLDGLPASLERDTNLIALVERGAGIAGTIAWIDGQLDLLNRNETYASFDSELMLALEGTYPLLRWLPNYLHYNYDGSPLRDLTRTLMVGRIEAPTLALAKGLIDKALAVEQHGLSGKVYLDARGLAKIDDRVTAGSVEDYDRSLLLAEKLFKENTDLEVVLNNTTDLFSQGQCPDAMLYCGWYSLSNYKDAFGWNPGAIGYHMASGEAATIRTASSQVWCKQMLDRGVGATMGPVYEPYLLSFPRPNEFFALLCSGDFTYVECMYRTMSTTSWTMTVIGDPLYNPFKGKNVLKSRPPEYARLFGTK